MEESAKTPKPEQRQLLSKILLTEEVQGSEFENDTFTIAVMPPQFAKWNPQFIFLLNQMPVFSKYGFVLVFLNQQDELIQHQLEHLASALRTGSQIEPVFAIGRKGEGQKGALQSYSDACKFSKELFFFTGRAFITQSDIDSDEDTQVRLFKKGAFASEKTFLGRTKELISYIEVYDLKKIQSLFAEQHKWLKQSSLSTENIKKLCASFMLNLQSSLGESNAKKEPNTLATADILSEIYGATHLSRITEAMSTFSTNLAEHFSFGKSTSVMYKILQYVQNHYNTDLKLESISSLFKYNTAYLGKKFHTHTGMSFNTYLDSLRIEKSKELLLLGHHKSYEISELVGYSSPDYFYLKFKKITGMTPTEYKEHYKTEGSTLSTSILPSVSGAS